MTYEELVIHLRENSDEKFAQFSKTLSNSDYIVIGVKNPVLRKIIKDHKDDNELDPSKFIVGKILEIDYIYFGLSISRLKSNKQKLEFLKKNIRYAKSWAITDTVSTYFKNLSFEEYYGFFLETHNSEYEYERRMAYILGLKVYKDRNILKIISLLKENETYMVMMAEAWLLSSVAIPFPNEVYTFLDSLNIEKKDIFIMDFRNGSVVRKTISKICDSFRFSEETKIRFKELRKNI